MDEDYNVDDNQANCGAAAGQEKPPALPGRDKSLTKEQKKRRL